MAKYEYSYPVEELDDLIDKLNKGVIPAVPDDMLDEARLRYQELQSELFDETDESVLTADEIRLQQEKIKKKVEEQKHKAHKDDIKVIEISEKQMERLKEAVETSIVRPYPSDYNMTDEEKYGSEERAALYEKFSKLKRIYRNPIDFKNAFKVCQAVIKDSLDNDYPGMSKAEVYRLFREGKIKVNIPIPRLFSDYVHEIKDVNVKIGIINGDITMVSKSDIEDELVINDRADDHETADIDVNVISDYEYNDMVIAHRKGYDTPLSMIFNNRSKIYNQLSVPANNMFSRIAGSDNIEDNKPFTFDFLQEDAPQKYFELKHGIDPYDPYKLAQFMNSMYDNKLPLEVRNAIVDGNRVYINKEDIKPKPVFEEDSFIHPKDDNVIELEKAILAAIQDSN